MDISVGKFDVVTTQNGGHDIEFYAERMVARMISVADTAPEPIRLQAILYRESLKKILLDGLRRAILSDRTTLINELNSRGLKEVAALIASKEV